MLSKNILNHVVPKLGHNLDIVSVNSVGGGSINDAYQLQTTLGNYFIKTNFASRYPCMFEREANGLELLRSSKAICIPEIIAHGQLEDVSYLILEWMESARPQSNFWQNFGQQLAQLHQNTSTQFGLEEDNYIGSLHQSNRQHATWEEFFIQERLAPQIKMGLDAGKLDHSTVQQFEKLYKQLPGIFSEEPPALLHGDLWSGNFMVGAQGEPVVMDPAVYYGHREMDLAMTRLFGGFSHEMYQTYHEYYPLAQGWEERVGLCNLYPLLVHVNLFGGGYLQQVKMIISKF